MDLLDQSRGKRCLERTGTSNGTVPVLHNGGVPRGHLGAPDGRPRRIGRAGKAGRSVPTRGLWEPAQTI